MPFINKNSTVLLTFKSQATWCGLSTQANLQKRRCSGEKNYTQFKWEAVPIFKTSCMHYL